MNNENMNNENIKKERIALIADSCCNVPHDFASKHNIYIIHTKVCYKDRDFDDDMGEVASYVLDNLEKEIPTTSLPSMEDIEKIFDKVKSDGYNKALVISISSSLSGTYNVLRLVKENYEGLDVEVIDTKNIGIGAGFIAMRVARDIESGLSFNELVIKTEIGIEDSKVFFIIDTLEYLKKGGRIGLVSYSLAKALNIKPIISCNDEGVYYSHAKARGRQKAILKTIEEIKKLANKFGDYTLSLITSGSDDTIDVMNILKEEFKNVEIIDSGISSSLVVHTGPGLLGIAIVKK